MNKTRNKKIDNLDYETTIKNKYKNKSMNGFINYKSLENNIFNIGLNIQEIDPKLKKYIVGKKDQISANIVRNKIKEKLEEFKTKRKDRRTQKERDLEEAIKNSSLKNVEKPLRFNKEKQLYKMEQYEIKRREKFPIKTKDQKDERRKT